MMGSWRVVLESAARSIPRLARVEDTDAALLAKHHELALLRAPKTAYRLGSAEAAAAHLVKIWGPTRVEYLRSVCIAVSEAKELLRWRRTKRAKGLSRHEARLVQVLETKYGLERVFHAALREVAKLDPDFAQRLTPRCAYLAAVACGIATPPRHEGDLRKAEDRWRRRQPEKIRPLEAGYSD
jgi:hypothetical protein